ncbi:MAG: TraB/GumN family protein [Rhizobacter sp.]|nr:TraB/GumN family protein [Ferruginibacter sp.]
MKHFKFYAVLSCFLICCISQAQDAPQPSPGNNNSLLWEVSGNGLAKPSYIFGTYHMLCKEQFVIKDKVKNALEKAAGIVTEVNFLDSAEIASMQKMMTSNKKLTETLNAAEQKEMDEALRAYGLSLKQADNFSLTLLYSLTALKAINCPPADVKMIDMELMQIAKGKGKSLQALETLAGQTSILGKAYSLQDVLQQMRNKEEMKKLYAQLAASYLAEDIVLLDKLLKHPAFMNKEQEKYMLTMRNHDWVTQMPAMMKNTSLFFAVGAGHLWGNDGIITLLIKKGYTLKPVFQ